MRNPRRQLASASAARLSGDDYQHVFTLMQAVRLLREDVWGVTRIAMEVDGAGNVDDLIIFYRDRPTVYHQIKFSRRAGEPLEHSWFTDPGAATRSPLQRFYASFLELTENDVPPEMALVTNRAVAASDPILENVEGRDGLLTPRLARPDPSAASMKVRAEWAAHLGISEEELFELLDHLKIEAGVGTLEVLRERCGEVMMAAGLRGDADAVILGNAAIRELIETGMDEVDEGLMRELVARHGLRAKSEVALLDIAAIDRRPFAETATARLDWLERYEGTEPRERRRLADPGAAIEMATELREARHKVESCGYSDIALAGAFRLDIGFAIGAEFADTAGFQVSISQRGELWSSEGEADPFGLAIGTHEIGGGDDLAVCLSISAAIAADVATFIDAENLPVAEIIDLLPQVGEGRASIASPAEARGSVQEVLDAVRRRASSKSRIHLFLAAPNALAVLLGHAWNRLPPTQVYADLSPGYQPTFLVAA